MASYQAASRSPECSAPALCPPQRVRVPALPSPPRACRLWPSIADMLAGAHGGWSPCSGPRCPGAARGVWPPLPGVWCSFLRVRAGEVFPRTVSCESVFSPHLCPARSLLSAHASVRRCSRRMPERRVSSSSLPVQAREMQCRTEGKLGLLMSGENVFQWGCCQIERGGLALTGAGLAASTLNRKPESQCYRVSQNVRLVLP